MKRQLALIILSLSLVTNAQAQASPDQNAQLSQALGKLNSTNLQQGLAIATLLGCTKKQAGAEQTQAFYEKMQAVGKQVHTLCKAGQPSQARDLVIQTFRDNHNDPVVTAANDCYIQNQANIDALAGPKIAPEMAKYIRLLHNPDQIDQQLTEQDVCKQKPAPAPVPAQ